MSKHTGEVPITIGGKKLTLKYDYAAMAVLDEVCTRDDLENLNRIPIKKLVAIVAAGLAFSHPDFGEAEIMAASPAVAPLAQSVDHALMYSRFGPETAEQIIAKMKELEEAAKAQVQKSGKPAKADPKKKSTKKPG